MIEDVYEPLDRYKYEFESKFVELAESKFDELVRESGVDVEKNRKTVAEIKQLKSRLSKLSRNRSIKLALVLLFIAGAIVGLAFISANKLFILGAILSAIFAYISYKSYKKCDEICNDLELKSRLKISEAMTETQPLNKLYTWDMPVKLIEKCVPRLKFDPYFTAERLGELRKNFGWSDSFNKNKSILFSQSGEINGNPFAIGEYLEFHWGQKQYTGYKTIYWTSYIPDSKGRMRPVTRSQTLSATISKPYPEYERKKVLIYGNEAAPNLSFSRVPSGLSTAGDGVFADLKKWWTLRKLKSFSRNLSDKSNYTLMSNHEFETLFVTKDRNNEVEYRLLFTPLAQSQMLKLLKDNRSGFGDDFTFIKNRKINLIYAKHLDETPIDTNPDRFKSWDCGESKMNFMHFNFKYFKSLYFAFAPLLSIPLYQQSKTRDKIYESPTETSPSFWEHEAIANYLGASNFESPLSDTQNILKTRLLEQNGGISKVEVCAHGFKGIPRVEYKTVIGGDLRPHSVPVEWFEYEPVENKGTIFVAETKEAADKFKTENLREGETRWRSIFSFLG